jgi:hypothetical protein
MKDVIQLFAVASLTFSFIAHAADKSMIDYFLPIPIHGGLITNTWGAPGVIPRDPLNGLEDPTLKNWYYWDGKIIKGPAVRGVFDQ